MKRHEVEVNNRTVEVHAYVPLFDGRPKNCLVVLPERVRTVFPDEAEAYAQAILAAVDDARKAQEEYDARLNGQVFEAYCPSCNAARLFRREERMTKSEVQGVVYEFDVPVRFCLGCGVFEEDGVDSAEIALAMHREATQ
jgi:Pyruvate/2-oxoacid:ferredoxin oxidoreductase delta subunit